MDEPGGQPAEKALPEFEVGRLYRALELDPFALDSERNPAFLLVYRRAQVILQRGHPAQDSGYVIVHWARVMMACRHSVNGAHPVSVCYRTNAFEHCDKTGPCSASRAPRKGKP
jgi:hypothetical protein